MRSLQDAVVAAASTLARSLSLLLGRLPIGLSVTKREQIAAVAQAADLTLGQARDALDAVAAVVTCGLLSSVGKIKIEGLGTFHAQYRAPRRVMNPATQVPMEIPATVVVKFKPVPELSKSVEERHR